MTKFDENNEDINVDDDHCDDTSVMDSIMQQTMNRIQIGGHSNPKNC